MLTPGRGLAGSTRILLGYVCLLLCGLTPGWGGTPLPYDLPAGEASRTLRLFAETSDREILFAAQVVRGVTTNAVRGDYTALEALERMLVGTRLQAVPDEMSGAIAVRPIPPPEPPTASGPRRNGRTTYPPSDPPNKQMKTKSILSLFLGLFVGLNAQVAPTDPATAGAISGRVYNPATGEYVRNAEVRLEGTDRIVITEENGSFLFKNAPAGEALVTVTYTGYTTARQSVTVTAGRTVEHEINLFSSLSSAGGEIVELQQFVVSSEREGNAKAIMEQKNSMNITNSVASDVFGDVAEGNVGEFLKHIPGVDLHLVQGEIVNVRLRGLGSEYNSVTIDGVSLGSADANKGAAGDARAFSFEQVSLSSMDSIEVSKTISADVDANAPAGTINLKTKRAFSRAGRRVAMQANLTALAGGFGLGRSYGPDDARHRRVRPGGIFEYSDVFLDRRLGVVLSVSESNLYSENARTTVTYNFTPTATDTRPVVPTAVALFHSPRLNRRSTVTLTTDFKATPNLVLSIGLIYNAASLYNIQRGMTFTATSRATVVGDDPLTNFTATGRINSGPTTVVKPGETYTVLPKFEYKLGNLLIEGRFAGSDSTSWYNPLYRKGAARNAGSPQLDGVGINAERASLSSGDWRMTQTAGGDLGVGDGYTNRVLQINDGRFGRTQVYSGDISATLKTGRFIPVTWKAGVKRKREIRDFRNYSDANNYLYTGPGAGTGVWADYTSPFAFNSDATKASLVSNSGKTIFVPDLLEIGRLYRERPDYFTHSLTSANYYNAYVANTRHYEEDITAGFMMGTASLGRASLRTGLRWERTETDALEFDPLAPEEVRNAGFDVVATTGRAATIPGLEYQYFSKPRVHRTGSYDNFFPSASLKYRFTRNIDFHLGYSSTIRRPTIRDLAGVWSINDESLSVAAPNPGLKPETSDNLAARLAYYFEPVGIFAFNLFQNTVDGLHRTSQMTAAEFGNDNPDLSDYTFFTTISSSEKVVIRGMELEYSQSLSFLPGPFKGLNVRASYTRNYSQVTTPQMSPHGVNGGINYSLGRFTVHTSANWRDDVPVNIGGTLYNRQRTTIDVGGSIKLSNRLNFFFTGRNILSEPVITMQKVGANPAVAQIYEVTTCVWTAGIKAVF